MPLVYPACFHRTLPVQALNTLTTLTTLDAQRLELAAILEAHRPWLDAAPRHWKHDTR